MKEYTYLPEVRQAFRCIVPNAGIRQVFMVDGLLQEPSGMENEWELTPGKDGRGLIMSVRGDHFSSPVQIISVRSEDMPHPVEFTNEWILAPGARMQLIVCDHTIKEYLYRTIRNTVISLGDGAQLDILFMQNEHKESSYKLEVNASLGEEALLDCHIISLYGGTISNTVNAIMEKPGARCNLDGLYLADGTQSIEYNVDVKHLSGNCSSNQLFKGVLDNRARASFRGTILVAKDSQKTEAFQANHNLLLTKEAKITTKPQLEIYADDVKCSHGASIGRLDELGLFYLRSRGISLPEAQTLQQMAFVQDVLGKIKTDTIRERLEKMVESRLRGEFSKCSHCTMHCC
ncbi:MAG TPA: SufD family Fe-S cluster assembly protein [Bacteroidales bacterium]|nr:SufD family Fe-S cluster assembly protein [Bacteroidales bacterium]